MALIKVLKIGSQGASTEHNAANDDVSFHDINASNQLTVATDKFVVDASGNMDAAGTGEFGGNVAMNTFKITGLGAGTANGDSVRYEQLTAEQTARANADSTLQSNIDAEATARANADSTLQSNIDSEATARANADSTLQANIDAEETARVDADATLQANIDAEETARVDADATIQAEVDVCIHANGSVDFTAAQSMGGFKITNLANGTNASDAVNFSQLSATVSGVSWKDFVHYAIDMAIVADTTEGAAFNGHASNDGGHTIATDDYVLSLVDGVVYKYDGAKFQLCDSTGPDYDDGDRYVSPSVGHARYVQIDLPDSPAGQENSAVYAHNGTSYVKISDFDWQLANGIDIAAGFTPQIGSISVGDSVQRALEYIQGNADAEITARSNADSTLQANIDAEETARVNADATLQANIDAEETARVNADATLQANIDAEETARVNADVTLQANIDAEITARTDADITLQANIDAEETARIAADDAEYTARVNADITLQANIDAEETARVNADATLQANIDAEETARVNADATLQANIDAEVTARSDADITLQANIDAEITARTNADTTIRNDLADHEGAADGASLIGYEYTVSTDWNADNQTVKAALDELASRTEVLESTGGSFVMTGGAGGISAGDAVRISGDDTVLPAQADSLANAACIGFAESAIAEDADGNISLSGSIVEGVLTSATAGAKYYLSADTAGAISTSVPSGSGEVILVVGYAKNETDLLVQIGDPKVRA